MNENWREKSGKKLFRVSSLESTPSLELLKQTLGKIGKIPTNDNKRVAVASDFFVYARANHFYELKTT
jgi:hypothetical protein